MRISYKSSKICYLATPPSCSLPPALHHTELLIWIHHITNHHKGNQSNSSQYHSFTYFPYSKGNRFMKSLALLDKCLFGLDKKTLIAKNFKTGTPCTINISKKDMNCFHRFSKVSPYSLNSLSIVSQ